MCIRDSLNTINRVIPYFNVNANTTHGAITYFLDSIQLEMVPNTVFTPSSFKEPSEKNTIVFGREISDGKVVTHYYNTSETGYTDGPQANVTPTGYPNPEPHGDFLVDTSNNNIMFRYYQKHPDARTFHASESTFAQTLNWSPPTDSDGDGWYTVEDGRTANALSTSYDALANAATAQAAADREILAFIQAGQPTASGNGDIWIDTDSYATLNTSSIYVYNAGYDSGAGRWEVSTNSAVGLVYLLSLIHISEPPRPL